jgi:hypothetical protein
MGGAFSTRWNYEQCIQNFGLEHLKYLGIDEMIILKWILK